MSGSVSFWVDVMFKLEDGTCYGHKALLMARSEVLDAMFKGDFKESFAQTVGLACLR